MSPQTTYDNMPDAGQAGMIVNGEVREIESGLNPDVAEVRTVDVNTATDSTDYTITINGVACTFTSGVGTTIALIRAGLIAAINDSDYNGEGLAMDVTAAEHSSDASMLVITDNNTGNANTLSATATILTAALSTAESGSIPFGVGVAEGTNDDECRLPSSSGDTLKGISVLDQSIEQEADGTHEYPADSAVSIMTKGVIWVEVEDAVTKGGSVYVRHTVGANGSQRGAIRSDTDSGKAAQLTGAVFASSASAGGLAKVKINKP